MSEPLRILHVTSAYLPAVRYGGPIYAVHGLCAALAARGHQVQVVTTNLDGPGDSDVPLGRPTTLDGVEVWYFPTRRLRRLCWSPEMGEALAQMVPRASVLHLHSVFLWPTVAAARAARRARRPYLMAPRGALVPELVSAKNRALKTLWLQLVERHGLAKAAGLHVTSRAEYEDARRLWLPLPPPCVVPNGVDVPELSEQPPMSSSLAELATRPYILFVGRVNWKKGLDRLLAALQGTQIRLLIAGNDEDGYRPYLDGLAAQYRLGEQVVFLGPVVGSDKAWLMHRARCLVLPSYNENFGNVVVEAMAVGTPVVITPEVGVREHVERSGAGLVTAGDPPELRAALDALWADPERRRQMGEAGQRYVSSELTWGAAARAMEACYREVIAGFSGRRAEEKK